MSPSGVLFGPSFFSRTGTRHLLALADFRWRALNTRSVRFLLRGGGTEQARGYVWSLAEAMLATNGGRFTNFNHGSFGSVPRIVIEQQRAFTEQMEARPDVWVRIFQTPPIFLGHTASPVPPH